MHSFLEAPIVTPIAYTKMRIHSISSENLIKPEHQQATREKINCNILS